MSVQHTHCSTQFNNFLSALYIQIIWGKLSASKEVYIAGDLCVMFLSVAVRLSLFGSDESYCAAVRMKVLS